LFVTSERHHANTSHIHAGNRSNYRRRGRALIDAKEEVTVLTLAMANSFESAWVRGQLLQELYPPEAGRLKMFLKTQQKLLFLKTKRKLQLLMGLAGRATVIGPAHATVVQNGIVSS
jgi:hypothetical protein